jgi:CubicO group peptidase (beta-lactamase class C family)
MTTHASESSEPASPLQSSSPGRCWRLALFLLVIAAKALAELPVSGRPVPGMTVFDSIVMDFMNSNEITAGVLGISRNGRIEYLRSFGWLIEPGGGTAGVPLPENAMMRTASCVKPVTAAAVRQFDSEGGFGPAGLNTNAFDNLLAGVGGLLDVTPRPVLADLRSANITLNQLLLHEGGFDRNTDPPGDVMFKSRAVADALRIPSPPSNYDIMAYMLGWPLKWAPGTVSNLNAPAATDAYSNYQGFQSALNRVSDGSYLRLRPGSQGWTGTIAKRVRLDAPEGTATLGR